MASLTIKDETDDKLDRIKMIKGLPKSTTIARLVDGMIQTDPDLITLRPRATTRPDVEVPGVGAQGEVPTNH